MTMKNKALAAAVFASLFAGSAFAETELVTVTSTGLASQVRQAIKSSPALAANQIHVQTAGGVVYLSGMVDTPLESAVAESAARGVAGVQSVVNSTSVSSGN